MALVDGSSRRNLKIDRRKESGGGRAREVRSKTMMVAAMHSPKFPATPRRERMYDIYQQNKFDQTSLPKKFKKLKLKLTNDKSNLSID